MRPPLTRDLPPPIRFRALGTTAVVAVTDAAASDRAGSLLATELDAIDRACSRFRDDSELARLNASAGRRAIDVDAAGRRVRIPRGVELDLGATAKAFAADRAATDIAEATGVGVIVSLGGDCAIAGPPPEGGWTIRVTDRHDAPANGPDPEATIALEAGGLATSGTSARNWTRGAERLHHLVDPRTGRPAASVWRTATVAAPT